MDRRAFLVTVGAVIAGAPLVGQAQQTAKVWRIGVLVNVPRAAPRVRDSFEAFIDELRQLGYREGQNVVIEWRHTEGVPERRRLEATALVQWKPDVVLTASGGDALVLREASTSVPIVVAVGGDLVGMGLAATLARPGGNVRGFKCSRQILPGNACSL
jgi:putative ABC transport system substrate-binding protein